MGKYATKQLVTREAPTKSILKNMLWKYFGVLPVALFLVCWYLLTEYIIPPLYWPSPRDFVMALYNLRFSIIQHISSTMFKILIGYFVGSLAGIGVGLLMTWNRAIYRFMDPLIESMRPVPPIATIPFFILWFGISNFGQILLIAMGVAMIAIVNTVEAVANISPIYINASRTLGASSGRIYRTIIIPAIAPSLVAGLRVCAASSFTLGVAAEFMGAQSGLGYVVMTARRTLQTPNILVGIVLTGILSALFDKVIRTAGNYITRWSEKSN